MILSFGFLCKKNLFSTALLPLHDIENANIMNIFKVVKSILSTSPPTSSSINSLLSNMKARSMIDAKHILPEMGRPDLIIPIENQHYYNNNVPGYADTKYVSFS